MSGPHQPLGEEEPVADVAQSRGGDGGVMFSMCLALVLVVGTVSATNLALPKQVGEERFERFTNRRG